MLIGRDQPHCAAIEATTKAIIIGCPEDRRYPSRLQICTCVGSRIFRAEGLERMLGADFDRVASCILMVSPKRMSKGRRILVVELLDACGIFHRVK